MTKIKSALLLKYRKSELLQFLTTVTEVLNRMESKPPVLQERIQQLENVLSEMKIAFNENMEDTLNGEVKPLDDARLNTLKGLKNFLKAEMYRDEPGKVKIAETLLKMHIKYCNRIGTFSLQHKTWQISELLNAWAVNPVLNASIDTINARSWVNQLSEQNAGFYSKYFEKATTDAPLADGNVLRKNAKVVYDNLSEDISSLARVSENNSPYVSLVNELNSLIEKNNQPIVMRTSRKKKETVAEVPTVPLPVPYVSV